MGEKSILQLSLRRYMQVVFIHNPTGTRKCYLSLVHTLSVPLPLLPMHALPAVAPCSRYPAKGRLETALTGEAVEVRRDLDLDKLRTDLQVGWGCTAVRVLQ